MMRVNPYIILSVLFSLWLGITPVVGQQTSIPLFSKENLVAWCIVPYDKMERNPEERASMLKSLGISKFAYDWREEHLPSLEKEIIILRQHEIELKSVWFWINGNSGSILDKNNEHILETLEKHQVKTELWVSFNEQFFEGLSEDEKLEKAVSAIAEIHQRVSAIGCKIGLYNHEGWFGEPENQIKIIESLGVNDIGIVYNFHHAHQQIDDFSKLVRQMKPYLLAVNLNGMRKEGPKILPIGQGNKEKEMLKILKDSGYQGSLGIIGHTEGEDVRVVLARNLSGLRSILKSMGEDEALRSY